MYSTVHMSSTNLLNIELSKTRHSLKLQSLVFARMQVTETSVKIIRCKGFDSRELEIYTDHSNLGVHF